MIKLLNATTLYLIDPSIYKWDIHDIINHPQSLHYIDCSELDGDEWKDLLICCPQFEELCTEYNGWSKMDGWDWKQIKYYRPLFMKYNTNKSKSILGY